MNYILTQEELDGLRAKHEKEAKEKYEKAEKVMEDRFHFIINDFLSNSNMMTPPSEIMRNAIKRWEQKQKHEKEIQGRS